MSAGGANRPTVNAAGDSNIRSSESSSRSGGGLGLSLAGHGDGDDEGVGEGIVMLSSPGDGGGRRHEDSGRHHGRLTPIRCDSDEDDDGLGDSSDWSGDGHDDDGGLRQRLFAEAQMEAQREAQRLMSAAGFGSDASDSSFVGAGSGGSGTFSGSYGGGHGRFASPLADAASSHSALRTPVGAYRAAGRHGKGAASAARERVSLNVDGICYSEEGDDGRGLSMVGGSSSSSVSTHRPAVGLVSNPASGLKQRRAQQAMQAGGTDAAARINGLRIGDNASSSGSVEQDSKHASYSPRRPNTGEGVTANASLHDGHGGSAGVRRSSLSGVQIRDLGPSTTAGPAGLPRRVDQAGNGVPPVDWPGDGDEGGTPAVDADLDHMYADALPLGDGDDADAAYPDDAFDDDGGGGGNVNLGESTSSWHISASGTMRLGGFLAINAGGIKDWGAAGLPGAASNGGASAGIGPLRVPPARRGHIKNELIMLDTIGQGATGIVQRALHLPTLQLTAVKHMRIYDEDTRASMVRELKALHANMIPLVRRTHGRGRGETATGLGLSGTLQAGGGLGTSADLGSTLGSTLLPPPRPPIMSWGSRAISTGAESVYSIDPDHDTLGQTAGSGSMGETAAGGGHGLDLSGSIGGGSAYENNNNQEVEVEPDIGGAATAHLVRLYDAYATASSGLVSIVMEYCGGGSLQDIVDCGGVRDERAVARIAAHSLHGLAWLHSNRQLHRDIKPANILSTTGGHCYKVADLGIVRQLDDTQAYAKTWTGTQMYMSPERIGSMATSSSSSTSADAKSQGGDQGYSFPSDVWALGLTLIAVIIGRYPFADTSYWELVRAIKDLPPPLHVVEGAYKVDGKRPSSELMDFLAKALDRDPNKRWSAEQLLQHDLITKHTHHIVKKTGASSGSGKASDSKADSTSPSSAPASSASSAVDDQEVGLALCESADAAKPGSRFPGPFIRLSTDEQDKLVELASSIVDKSLDKVHWQSFVRYFRRYRNRRRRKAYFSLDETSFNTYVADRVSNLAGTLGRGSSGLGLGGGIGASRSAIPSMDSVASGRMLAVGHIRDLTAGESAHSRGDHGQRHQLPESSVSGRAASLAGRHVGGGPAAAYLPPPSYRELQLDIDDVRTLAAQLGLPPLFVRTAYNDLIKKRIFDSSAGSKPGAGLTAGMVKPAAAASAPSNGAESHAAASRSSSMAGIVSVPQSQQPASVEPVPMTALASNGSGQLKPRSADRTGQAAASSRPSPQAARQERLSIPLALRSRPLLPPALAITGKSPGQSRDAHLPVDDHHRDVRDDGPSRQEQPRHDGLPMTQRSAGARRSEMAAVMLGDGTHVVEIREVPSARGPGPRIA